MNRRLLQPTLFVWILGLLLAGSMQAKPIVPYFSIEPGEGDSPEGFVIRIRGKVLETHSGLPLKSAAVIIKIGDQIVATRLTSKDGQFVADIPRDLAQNGDMDISIEYMDHVFLHQNMKVASQNVLVKINGEILLDDDPIADYKLPIHTLNNPNVGTIEVRLRQLKPKSVGITDQGEV